MARKLVLTEENTKPHFWVMLDRCQVFLGLSDTEVLMLALNMMAAHVSTIAAHEQMQLDQLEYLTKEGE